MVERTLAETLAEVWRQVLREEVEEVDLGTARNRVGRSRNQGLRIVAFTYGGRAIEGVEQNPNTRSRWAQLAQSGQRILQFSFNRRYFANVCEGRLTRYPAWTALGLPD